MLKSGLLNKKQINELQKEIEANYIDNLKDYFKRKKQDIRMNVFNYDNPLAEKNINGVNFRVALGLIRNKRKSYLLYKDGSIVGQFYSMEEITRIL